MADDDVSAPPLRTDTCYDLDEETLERCEDAENRRFVTQRRLAGDDNDGEEMETRSTLGDRYSFVDDFRFRGAAGSGGSERWRREEWGRPRARSRSRESRTPTDDPGQEDNQDASEVAAAAAAAAAAETTKAGCGNDGSSSSTGRRRKGGGTTKGMRAIERVMGPAITAEDKDEQMANDTEHLVWLPIKSRFTQTIENSLGPLEAGARCYGCEVGGPVGKDRSEAMEEMASMFTLGSQFIRIDYLCAQMEAFFEDNIRTPDNAMMEAAGVPADMRIPPWSARCIYEHYWKHLSEPGAFLTRTIAAVDDVIDFQLNNALFLQNATAASEQKMHPNSWKIFKDAVDMACKLRRLKSSDFALPEPGDQANSAATLRRVAAVLRYAPKTLASSLSRQSRGGALHHQAPPPGTPTIDTLFTRTTRETDEAGRSPGP